MSVVGKDCAEWNDLMITRYTRYLENNPLVKAFVNAYVFSEDSSSDEDLEDDKGLFEYVKVEGKKIAQHTKGGESFRRLRSENLMEKKETKQETKIYQCKICARKLKTRKGYREHMKLHKITKKAHSSSCPRRPKITKKALLQVTKKAETKKIIKKAETKYQLCEFCSAQFTSSKELKAHQKKEHRKLNAGHISRQNICNICNRRFKTEWTLQEHKTAQHVERYKQTADPVDCITISDED